MDHCDECGFHYGSIARDAIGGALLGWAQAYADRLTQLSDEILPTHPRKGIWSALEYACHVRDVLLVQRERVEQALVEEQPTFAPMRREELVRERHYNKQQPRAVAEELVAAAGALATVLDQLPEAAWQRTAVYNWPTRAVRTLDWVGRQTLHEVIHHLMDIDRLTAA